MRINLKFTWFIVALSCSPRVDTQVVGTGGDVSQGGTAELGGDMSLGGTAEVGGDTSIGGSAEVGGDTSIGGNAEIGGDTSLGGNAEVGGIGPEMTGGSSALESGGSVATGGSPSTSGNPETGGAATGGISAVPIGTVGASCAPNGALACEGHASAHRLVCANGAWATTSTCNEGQLCDTRVGDGLGACLPVIAECAGKNPDDAVCIGQDVALCGPDLLTTTVSKTCTNQVCVKGVCQGQCAPNQTQCDSAGTNGVQTCNATGSWGDAVACANQTCVKGVCQGQCAPGQTQCDSESTVVQTCTKDGTWGTSIDCPSHICVKSECVPPLVSGAQPVNLALDAAYIYWTDVGGTINKVPIEGGEPTILASGQSSPTAIAVDSTNVYWTNTGSKTIMKAPLVGGAATTLVSGQDYGAYELAVDSTGVYWTTDAKLRDTMMGYCQAWKAPIEGGVPTIVNSSTAHCRGLKLQGSSLYWGTNIQGTYFASSSSIQKIAVPIVTNEFSYYGPPSGNDMTAFTVDALNLYISGTQLPTTRGGTSFSYIAVQSMSGAATRSHISVTQALSLAVDASDICWIESQKRVLSAPIAGGATKILASGQNAATSIKVDGNNVYWATPTSVMKLRK